MPNTFAAINACNYFALAKTAIISGAQTFWIYNIKILTHIAHTVLIVLKVLNNFIMIFYLIFNVCNSRLKEIKLLIFLPLREQELNAVIVCL